MRWEDDGVDDLGLIAVAAFFILCVLVALLLWCIFERG